MTAPITLWNEQENINVTTQYDDATLAYDDPNTFYNGYDPTDYDPPAVVWTDET